LYEQAMPALPITEHVCSFLPTPVVNDMGAGKTQEWWADWTDKIGGHGDSLDIVARQLAGERVSVLPTPRAQNGEDRNQRIYHREGPRNLETVLALLPTPRASTQPMKQNPGWSPSLKEVIHKIEKQHGENTGQQSDDGSTFLDVPHQPQLWNEPE
tara:strand:+ start:7698 stop:8165 length:468 start_codon:yes stop_codon:yes gene_type:complete